ncbi:EAL domain-containing protein [Nodosilinea sp. LEGE 07298]|uniref:putative bifunctional diguanylate cyclase/phosphodiesterase n=1 Tax=Nodosilinea sp. LEGE 07298 TaxID=2777970 RepID=UPI00187F437F|nr:EAL domain-containing protein [Nodosilinea sp. LEGE 07298]MBE9110932.1 EAL domain-containing protein [Nodosilinea sp. LEGE 07298]
MLKSQINPIQDTSLLLCHELRTPLTSIQGALKLLGYQHLGSLSEDAQHLLAIAIDNADRLVRLANALEVQTTPLLTVLSTAKVELLQLENDLYKAIERREFYLVYQPIVCLETSQIIGFEALARWRHDTRGEISPQVFIPLAEKANLICDIGLFLLDKACCQLSQWQAEFPSSNPLSISVNLSAIQLQSGKLVEKVSQILSKNSLPFGSLKLEITESALVENEDVAVKTLVKLQQLGVQIYIDDFGTGYSSLGRLQELPFDTLKIDQSFVRNKNWVMSETILMLAQKLNLDVIVEGVESLEELTALKQLGCRKMQGYFFSKPTDPAGVAALLNHKI